ncbi:MAG: lysozyme inhibitor LprI family protein [Pseudomonadota bacterium]
MKLRAFGRLLGLWMVAYPLAGLADPTLECNASSQVEIGECLNTVAAGVDGALEVALEIAGSAAAELDEVTGREVAGPALEAAQAAWVAWRDAQCDFVGAGFGGGSGTGIAIAACRIDLGRARVDQLIASAQ